MRVLVTGAFGFIGTAVVKRLTMAGHDVVALTHKPPGTPMPASRARAVMHGDICDTSAIRAAVSGVDAVCHLAALSVARESFARPAEYNQVNAVGTRSIVAALAARATESGNSALFVHASTHAVYGPGGLEPITEIEPLAPMSPYGHSKMAAEHAVAAGARAGALSAVCLRLANVAGAVDNRTDTELNHIIPRVLEVAAGRVPVLGINGDGSTIRDFVHVADAADAFLLALGACLRCNFAVYNVGATAASTIDIVTAAERVTGRAIPVVHNPPAAESPMMIADITRIGRDLSWAPRRSSLSTIISDAWDVIVSNSDISHRVQA
jgi:UDP-glucose 4-epimerase